MERYRKAYRLRDLRRYGGWTEKTPRAGTPGSGHRANGRDLRFGDEHLVYLHEDFVVTADSPRNEHILFDEVTDAWRSFCRKVLDFSPREEALAASTPSAAASHAVAVESAALSDGGRGAETDWSNPIHRIFEAWAAREPHAVAVVDESQSLTYGALNRGANRLARQLISKGVRPGDFVAVCLERSADLILAMVAVLKAGAAYVPIDSRFPAKRIQLIAKRAGCMISEEATRDLARAADVGALDLQLDAAGIAGRGAGDLLEIETPEQQAAYLMYTSGSSGRPKGTLVTHRNVTRLFSSAFQLYDFAADGVWSFFHSISFDFSVWEIFGALLTGGRLVVTPHWTARSPDRFAQLLKSEGVTVLSQTPSAFQQLLTLGRLTDDDPESLRLRWVVFGGEALYMKPLQSFCGPLEEAGVQLVNMYGITETTVHVTHRLMSHEDALEDRSWIGAPLPDLDIRLLDRHLNAVPESVAGEIFVAGSGVALGYAGSPGLTAQRFVPDPWGDWGQRLYRSGDLGRSLGEWGYEYLGRGDNQVKVRGFRIEPDEVRFYLMRQASVRDAAVRAVDDQAGDRVLAAYLVPADSEFALAPLWESLREDLPEHLIPAVVHVLEKFPLTNNGKIDFQALPDAARIRPEEKSFVPPQSWEQEVIADAWRDLLGLPAVGIHDDFFIVGGDSIKALRVIARLKALGFDLSTETLFEHPTIAGLSRTVASASRPAAIDLVLPDALSQALERALKLLPQGAVDAYPLTQLQLGMLFHTAESREEVRPYHNVSLFRLQGEFNQERFRRAVSGLISSHPALRTAFELEAFGLPMQVVYENVALPVSVQDLSDCDEHQQQREIERWLESEKSNLFSYRTAPLIRFHIAVFAPNAFYLGLTEHHSILDGWSVASLLTELFQDYLGGAPAEEPAAAYDAESNIFRRYVLMEQAALADSGHREFWKDYLSDYARLRLPARGTESEHRIGASAVGKRRVEVDSGLTDSIKALASEVQVPLKSVCLAAHLAVLGFITNSDDAMTGLIAHGRPEVAGGEGGLGLFLNTLPFRMRQANASWREWLRAVFEEEKRILPYRRYPLAAMRDRNGRKPDLETAFNFVNFHVYERLEEDASVKVLDSLVHEETDFDLLTDFSLLSRTAELDLTLSYRADRFSQSQIEAFSDYYLRCFELMTQDPSARVCALSLDDRGEASGPSIGGLQKVGWQDLRSLSATAWTRECADRVALIDGQRCLSYGRLRKSVRSLSTSLQALGVTEETPVAVLLHKSLEWFVAALAVIDAGGGYVPIDPSDPAERVNFMIENAAAPVVITDAQGASLLTAPQLKVISVQHLSSLQSRADAEFRPPQLVPDNLAYILYTSGSTGQPKGVAMHHGGIANLMSWQAQEMPIENQRLLQYASSGFDVSVQEILTSLMGRNSLVIVPSEMRRDFVSLSQMAAEQQIECVFAPDTALKALLTAAASIGNGLTSLKTIVQAGEALVLDDALSRFVDGGGRLLNQYGPTESHVVTSGLVAREEPRSATHPSIGREIAGTRLLLLDSWQRPLPLGSIGEIHIASVNVARSYHGAARLTAQRFVPNPLPGAIVGERVFKTGDLAHRDLPGRIWFVGRADSQVKVRGYRIELEEVRQAFMRHPSVDEAVATVLEGDRERRLCLHFASAAGAEPRALRDFAAQSIPAYMVPSYIIPVASIPITKNGKIDYSKLPGVDSSTAPAELRREPKGSVETPLLELWKEVLGSSAEIGSSDDFLEIGGSSLTLLQLQLKIQSRFEIRMSLARLVANSSFRSMGRLIREALGPKANEDPAPSTRKVEQP